ncbi:MAG: hypothetical protein ACK4S0_14370, partial [Sediminibacterium sp.]
MRISFFILFLLTSIAAHGQVIFQRSYLPDSTADKLEGTALVKNYDGRYFISGNIFSLPPTLMPRNATLHRLDSLGQMIDSRVYYSPSALSGYGNHIEKADINNFIITGGQTFPTGLQYPYYAGFLMKIDSSGAILWNRVLYDSSFHTNTTLFKTIAAGNYFYSFGNTNVNRNVIGNWYNDTTYMGLITKTDQNGNLIWAKNYYNRTIRFKDFALSPDSGLFVVADRIVFDSLGSSDVFGLFIRLDTSGTVQWTQEWDYVIGGTLNTALNDGSGFLIGALDAVIGWSNGIIIKLDYSGNFLWAKKYGIAGGDYQVSLLTLLDNQKIAFSNWGLTFHVFDPFANIIYYRSLLFTNFPQGIVNDIQPESDFGLSGIGHRGHALYIFKSDSNFFSCGYTGSILPANSLITFYPVSLNVSPLNIDYSSFGFVSSLFNTTDSLHCFTSTSVLQSETNSLFEVYPTLINDGIININFIFPFQSDFKIIMY